jgi:hypothetical protein
MDLINFGVKDNGPRKINAEGIVKQNIAIGLIVVPSSKTNIKDYK